jgi:hypothetical protein
MDPLQRLGCQLGSSVTAGHIGAPPVITTQQACRNSSDELPINAGTFGSPISPPACEISPFEFGAFDSNGGKPIDVWSSGVLSQCPISWGEEDLGIMRCLPRDLRWGRFVRNCFIWGQLDFLNRHLSLGGTNQGLNNGNCNVN